MRFPPPFWTFEPQNRPQARSVSPFSPFFEAMLDFLTIFSAVGLQQELKKAHGEQSLVIREDDASPSSLVESAAGHIADAMDAFDTVVSESFGAFLGSPEESKPAPKKAWGRLGAPVVHAELPLHCLESLRLCILPRWHKDAEPDLWQRAASQSAICQVRKAQCERSFFPGVQCKSRVDDFLTEIATEVWCRWSLCCCDLRSQNFPVSHETSRSLKPRSWILAQRLIQEISWISWTDPTAGSFLFGCVFPLFTVLEGSLQPGFCADPGNQPKRHGSWG